MISQEDVNKLEPMNWGSLSVEPFHAYISRVKSILPSWPKSAVEQWLHRHYPDMVRDYRWLLTETDCSFELTKFSKRTVTYKIDTHKMNYVIDPLGGKILSDKTHERSWLQAFMIEYHTWPTQIIVLDNFQGRIGPHGEVYGKPYHLLEGHLRLGYFRALHKANRSLLPSHHVWLVTVD